MPSYEVTILIKRPVRVRVDTKEGKPPIVFDQHGFAHIKVEGQEGMIVPSSDVLSADLIVEKPQIVSPHDQPGPGPSGIIS